MNKLFHAYSVICMIVGYVFTPILVFSMVSLGIQYYYSTGTFDELETGVGAPIVFDIDRSLIGDGIMQTWVAGTAKDRWDWMNVGDPQVAGSDLHIGVNTFTKRQSITRPTSVMISRIEVLKELYLEHGEKQKDIEIHDRQYNLSPFIIHEKTYSKRCVGFQSISDEAGNQVRGWYCANAGESPDPVLISCILESIVIKTGSPDSGNQKNRDCARVQMRIADNTKIEVLPSS